MDLNDNPPMFVNKPYYAVLSREADRDTQVIRVMAVDLDKGSNGDIYYQLVRGNGDLFRVGRKSGLITLKKKLNSSREDFILTVAAYDGGSPPYLSETQVLVKIVEESVPSFEEQSYKMTVAEDVETYSPVLKARAISPNGGDLIYTIESGNEEEMFSVDYKDGVIFVNEGLDFETRAMHQLTLRATDKSTSGYSEAIVFITLSDANDNTPQFNNDSYYVTVSESLALGSVLIKVEASDKDSGMNAEIEYTIDIGETSRHNDDAQLFAIDAETGEISLAKLLDYERHKSHTLTIHATDKGSPPRTGETIVFITVEDSNDNPPSFDEAEYNFSLSKQATRGQFVGKVRAVDPDYTDNVKLRYSVTAGNEHQVFSIDEKTGSISLINLHSFEKSQDYLLNISVSDGVYARSTKVGVNLYSSNRYNPEFRQSLYEVKMRENSPAGSEVVRVSARDMDGNDRLTFSIISEKCKHLFKIDPNNGLITTTEVLDREVKESYDIPVQVNDGNGRNGFTTVKIILLDENDNAPEFPLPEYKANIPSDLSAGTEIIKVSATDKDVGPNAELKYSIYDKQSSGVNDIFKINKETGQIFLRAPVKELENQVFQFFVRAEDRGGENFQHSDCPVEVFIRSPLDAPPIFQKINPMYFLSEDSPVGTIVAELAVIAAPDVTVNYQIASRLYAEEGTREEDALFQVDPKGRVIISNLLDREVEGLHNIVVMAETDSSPSLNAYMEISVQVLDVNDNAPRYGYNLMFFRPYCNKKKTL